jgi:hypothetical protein
VETDDFSLSLLLRYLGPFLFIPKYFLFCFKGFLFKNFRHSIDLANIIGFVLTNILGISSIFNIAWSNILLLVFLVASIRSYVSFTSFGYHVTKRNKTIIVMFG